MTIFSVKRVASLYCGTIWAVADLLWLHWEAVKAIWTMKNHGVKPDTEHLTRNQLFDLTCNNVNLVETFRSVLKHSRCVISMLLTTCLHGLKMNTSSIHTFIFMFFIESFQSEVLQFILWEEASLKMTSRFTILSELTNFKCGVFHSDTQRCWNSKACSQSPP